MKKIIITLFIVLFTTLTLSAAVISSPAATVNLTKNKVISTQELKNEVDFYKANGYTTVTDSEVLDAMIGDVLIEQGAERDGYSITSSEVDALYKNQKTTLSQSAGYTLSDEEYEELVVANYGSVDEYKKYLKQQYISQLYVSSVKKDMISDVKEPTDREIQTWYKQNAATAFAIPERVRLSVIAKAKTEDESENIKKKAEMEECFNKIKNGSMTFEKAVQTYTEDTSTLSKGGDWGYLSDNSSTRTRMGDEFVEDALFLEPGDITEKVYETPTMYIIAKCTVHDNPKILGINDEYGDYGVSVKEYIKEGLIYQNTQLQFAKAYSELVSELRSQAKINILLK